jgi:hypothetical protein
MTTKKATAVATADPCGMTKKKDRQPQRQQQSFGSDKNMAKAKRQPQIPFGDDN